MSAISLSDSVVLITGGARGIGAATAKCLVNSGAKVVIADVLDDEGKALAASLGEKSSYCHLDVTQVSQWQSVVAHCLATFGKINGLFNNAGIASFNSIETETPDGFERVMSINLLGVFLGIQAVIEPMKQTGGGVIINMSSTAGLQGYAGLSAYVASKWGVRGLTKAVALDLAPYGIRVLSIHPGPIRTPMTAQMPEAAVAAQPIARFGEPDEVAAMVKFMMAEASFSTGSEFVVDGGAVTGQVLALK
ncbi:SDR family NAD(P)-dependent oxidoreductase [Orrella daihaiensis]|uniref:SDR family oxidoreductase n=1 Tax=Orrella daihaiensis TaxID=2782176 RepID=A0ABY4AM94_9BURK|nr:SDR family NAD(P)-dependent oxidoreductase [Orrella daihaiensis]UOD51063.1 SDR family oxidoreductase [Orrella daihaiensis]